MHLLFEVESMAGLSESALQLLQEMHTRPAHAAHGGMRL